MKSLQKEAELSSASFLCEIGVQYYLDEFGFRLMLVERPNHKELTPDELQSLKKLHSVIDQAIADGKISKYEMDLIDRTIHSDNHILVEEIALVRELIQDKISSGLLSYDWNS